MFTEIDACVTCRNDTINATGYRDKPENKAQWMLDVGGSKAQDTWTRPEAESASFLKAPGLRSRLVGAQPVTKVSYSVSFLPEMNRSVAYTGRPQLSPNFFVHLHAHHIGWPLSYLESTKWSSEHSVEYEMADCANIVAIGRSFTASAEPRCDVG